MDSQADMVGGTYEGGAAAVVMPVVDLLQHGLEGLLAVLVLDVEGRQAQARVAVGAAVALGDTAGEGECDSRAARSRDVQNYTIVRLSEHG
jgi:hypothetical protein